MIINIGIDSADIDRFEQLLNHNHSRLFSMMFGEEERAAMPTLSGQRRINYVAGRWAAKEAVLKALGTGINSVTLTDVGVFSHQSGQPYIKLAGRAVQRSQALGINHWHLSMTYTKGIATAYVIAERTTPQNYEANRETIDNAKQKQGSSRSR